MKRTYNKIKIFSLAASCLMLLVSSCAKNDLEESTLRRSNEVRIAASVGAAVSAPVDTKGALFPESTVNPSDRIIEFKSADGSIILPVRLSLTENPIPTSTKGTYINGPDGEGIFPTENLALSKAMDNFMMEAYYTDNQNSFVPANSIVEYKNSKWTLNKTYYWPQSTGIDFYAYANMPSKIVPATSIRVVNEHSDKQQRLYYQVPDDTDNQTDILMAVYSGTGNTNGEAELLFRHPLTSVQFCRANPDVLKSVSKITMGGVHFKGEAVQSLNGSDFKWENIAGSEIVEQGNDGKPFEVHGKIDGEPFLLIPQNLNSKPVDLTVIVNIDGHDIPLNSTLLDVNWETGKTYTYTIDFVGTVECKMTIGSSAGGTIQTNPVIQNIGTKKCYVRATAVGYITDDKGNIKSTWLKENEDGTITNKGTFTVKDGSFGTGTWNTYWKAGTDGFWYYTKPLEWTGTADVKQTTPLFDKYQISGLGTDEKFDLVLSAQIVEWDEETDELSGKKIHTFAREAWGEDAASLLE